MSLTTTSSSVAPKSLAMSFDQAADEGVAATSTAGFLQCPNAIIGICVYQHLPPK